MPIVLIENFRAVFYAPFYAACSTGAYVAEGLEVELKVAAELGKALQAVTAGAGQVSWGGPLRIQGPFRVGPREANESIELPAWKAAFFILRTLFLRLKTRV